MPDGVIHRIDDDGSPIKGFEKHSELDPSNVLPDTRSILAGAFGKAAKASAEKQKVAQYRASIGQAAPS